MFLSTYWNTIWIFGANFGRFLTSRFCEEGPQIWLVAQRRHNNDIKYQNKMTLPRECSSLNAHFIFAKTIKQKRRFYRAVFADYVTFVLCAIQCCFDVWSRERTGLIFTHYVTRYITSLYGVWQKNYMHNAPAMKLYSGYKNTRWRTKVKGILKVCCFDKRKKKKILWVCVQ